jgi:hypothetical protein
VHFLDAWTELSLFDLVRLLAPAIFLAAAAFVPGHRVARVAAFGIALSVPFLRELELSPLYVVAWVGIWLALAWRAGLPEGEPRRPIATTRGALESGAIGLLLGIVLLTLLLAAVARQDLSPEDGRCSSLGVLLLGLGLIHLMLRRHVRRAGVAFAAMGLGVQTLDGAARAAQVPGTLAPQGAVLLCTVLAIWLAMRLASTRSRYAGTAWVSDAHDLHD